MKDFPLHGLLPKAQTQALSFQESLGARGEGTRVAILDTGVDPGAPGLLKTPQGSQKLVAIIDCTGTGDVTCQEPQELSPEKTLAGVSGRKLVLNAAWPKPPTGRYFVGLKNTSDLFPGSLVERLKKETRKSFETAHHLLATAAITGAASSKGAKEAKEGEKSKAQEKLLEAEHKNRVSALEEQLKAYQDAPLVLDCVWFHTGEKWVAAIDKTETGDFSQASLLAEYEKGFQYASFGKESMLNYTVNVYDEGQTLSIVTTSGSHGTHVAAITGAYFEGQDHLNGVAPGAELVSMKIGDNRLGSMETGTGLTRAAMELCRLKCDLANMSYGEACSVTNKGRFIQLVRDEWVNKSNGILVTSAGNAGPALSTVGAPGGFSSGIISVGAYVNHAMMDAEYAMLDKVEERPYTWSSRGPSLDGDVGVDIYAPGAAITSVPQFTLQNAQLMNGTSMASPNCCGCVALLVSALKAKNILYTPYLIKRALQASGLDIKDPHGVKFVQVENAFKYLEKAHTLQNFTLHYDVTVGSNSDRGVYLRDIDETNRLNSLVVNVQPIFPKSEDPEQNAVKLTMEAHLVLESSHSWIKIPDHAHLNNGGRSFGIQVDTTHLEPGFHFGQIAGYDNDHKDIGPLFQVPVTICKPDSAVLHSFTASGESSGSFIRYPSMEFTPGAIVRRFVSVPAGCNFAELTVKSLNRDTAARFYVHMMQIVGQSRYPRFEHDLAFTLNSTDSGSEADTPVFTKAFRVLPNVTMEVCLAQFWSSLKQSNVTVELKFYGLSCSSSGEVLGGYGLASNVSDMLFLTSGTNGFTRMDVAAHIRKIEIAPSVSLDTLRRCIRPTADYKITPLKSRDVLPDTKQVHQLELTYEVKVAEGDSTITPQFPRMNEVLYESTFENFCCIVFDAQKRSLSYQDVYPKSVKVPQGSLTIKVQVTSANTSILEKLSSMPMLLDLKLSKSVSMPLSSTIDDLITGSTEGVFKKKTLLRGERTTFFVGDASSMPKEASAGDLLIGTMDLSSIKLDGPLYRVSYLVPPEAAKASSSSTPENKKEEPELLKEAVRDLEISWLKKIKSDEFKATLLARLEKENPNFIPVHRLHLESLFTKLDKLEGAETQEHADLCRQTIKVADQILAIVNASDLAMYFGVHHENETPEEKETAKNKGTEKDALVYASVSKTHALRDLLQIKDGLRLDLTESESNASFDASLNLLSQWVGDEPTTHGRYLLLWTWSQQQKGYYATALKAVQKYLSDSKKGAGAPDSEEAIVWKKVSGLKVKLYEQLDWKLWVAYEKRWEQVKFPKAFARF